MKKVIYTVGNDRMASYLSCLLESIRTFNADIEINVIPFDDSLSKLPRIAEVYKANIIDTDDVWDRIGKSIYGDIEYRPGISSWRYFRKLNVFNRKDEEFLFLDANVLCLINLEELNRPKECDFLFHNHSVMGRCFRRPEFESIISNLSPGIKGGYNMGFFMSNSSNLDSNIAEALSRQNNLIKYFGKAPEQAFLAYYIALTNKSHNILSNYFDDAPYNHTSNQSVTINSSGEYIVSGGHSDGKKVYVLKSGGQDLDQTCNAYEIIKKFHDKAQKKIVSF